MPSCGQTKRGRVVEANCPLAESQEIAQVDAYADPPPQPSSPAEDAAANALAAPSPDTEGAQRSLPRRTAAAAAAAAGAGAPVALVPTSGAVAGQNNSPLAENSFLTNVLTVQYLNKKKQLVYPYTSALQTAGTKAVTKDSAIIKAHSAMTTRLKE